MKTQNPSPFPELTAAHATMIGADAVGASGGQWIMLMPLGRFSGRDGRGPYDSGDAAQMAEVISETKKRASITELVIDYDHQSVFAAVPGVGGIAPAAGWIKDFDVRADGLYGLVEWTARAARAIKAGEYRYISPVYQHDKSGKVLRLISAGLTNTPNLDLAAVAASASLNPQEENMDKIALALGLAQGAGEADCLAAINTVLATTTAIAAAAGLAAGAKLTDVVPAIAAMRADIDKVATASGLTAGAKADEIVVAVQTAIAGKVDPTKFVPIAAVVAMQTDLNALKTKVTGDSAEVAVNAAMAEGKITPALKQWAVDLYKADVAQFNAFVGAAPVLTATQRTSVIPPTGGDPVLSETDIAVMTQLGLSREAFLKAKKEGEA